MGKNKMRREKNVMMYVYMGIIGFLILFCCYLAYIILDYQNINNVESLSMTDFIGLCNLLGAPVGSVPLSFPTILTILKMQITTLWWVYAVAAIAVFLGATSNPKDDYRGMEQGSARWADKYDAKLFQDKTGIPMANKFYATITNPNKKSYSPHNLNEMVIGGSGAGKSFRKIIPDIMQMYGSYVVTDPKGELYRNTAKFLTEAGYKIRVLNLQDINYSNAYNPFAYMVDEQDCISIANLFMANSAGDGEKPDFWAAAAEDLLVAIMVYLFKTAEETKSFGRVIRLVNSIRYKNGKIDQKCELARCFNRHGIEYPNDVVTVNWNSIQGTPEAGYIQINPQQNCIALTESGKRHINSPRFQEAARRHVSAASQELQLQTTQTVTENMGFPLNGSMNDIQVFRYTDTVDLSEILQSPNSEVAQKVLSGLRKLEQEGKVAIDGLKVSLTEAGKQTLASPMMEAAAGSVKLVPTGEPISTAIVTAVSAVKTTVQKAGDVLSHVTPKR